MGEKGEKEKNGKANEGTRVIWDLRRATLASYIAILSNASVACLKLKKKMNQCITDHVCALGNNFHFLVRRANMVHFPIKSSIVKEDLSLKKPN